eukprot:TRINITY_DN28346_c0_g1_i1.p1 TRINITY_DN28346_c0_g1~~TRINITY_DN28346_c0_g1_i1.p1  ORF type:complete len:278 (+),score=38.57 TRINITY_DN28346_c0_g1_i1:96-929(+)
MSRWGSWVVPGNEGRHSINRITVKRRQDLHFNSFINAHPQKTYSKRRGVGVGVRVRVGVTVLNLTPKFTPRGNICTPTPVNLGVKRGRGGDDFFSCCRVQQVEKKQLSNRGEKRASQDFQREQNLGGQKYQQQKQIRESEGGQRQILSICEFLKGKTLFVTGSTGFLAKVLIEKILFEQPDVKKIYLLIQRRNGMTAQDRLKEQVLASPAFNRLETFKGNNSTSLWSPSWRLFRGIYPPQKWVWILKRLRSCRGKSKLLQIRLLQLLLMSDMILQLN